MGWVGLGRAGRGGAPGGQHEVGSLADGKREVFGAAGGGDAEAAALQRLGQPPAVRDRRAALPLRLLRLRARGARTTFFRFRFILVYTFHCQNSSKLGPAESDPVPKTICNRPLSTLAQRRCRPLIREQSHPSYPRNRNSKAPELGSLIGMPLRRYLGAYLIMLSRPRKVAPALWAGQ